MKIVVIDGQGGRLGKLLVEAVKDRIPQAEVLAVGTNGIATATMQKAGADYVATGENPVVRGVMDADVVLGPSILGEVTPPDSGGRGRLPGKKDPDPHEQLRRVGGRNPGDGSGGVCEAGRRSGGGLSPGSQVTCGDAHEPAWDGGGHPLPAGIRLYALPAPARRHGG